MANDDYLAKEIKEGNRLAFTMAFEKYHRAIYAFAYKYICDRAMAEDIVQHTFLKLWETRKSLNASSNLVGYIYTTAKHYTLNCIRNQSTASHGDDYYYRQFTATPSVENTSEPENDDMLIALRSAIARLSPCKQEIVNLKLNEGLSNSEVAQRLNISINTVKVQYNRSLKELRNIIIMK